MKTNKFALIFSSKLFKKIFETSCDCNNLLQEYDILCPDFNPDSVAKVLELVNSGTTDLSIYDVELRTGMISIIQSLQIDINLPVTHDNIPKTSPKLTDLNDKRKNMDPVTDKFEVFAQYKAEKCDKIPMIVETTDKIEMAKSCDIEMTSHKTLEMIDAQEKFTEMPKSSTDSEMNEIITKLQMPYSCEYCDKRFHVSIGLQKHMKKHLNKSKKQDESAVLVEQQQHQKEQQMENDHQEIIDPVIREIEEISLHCPMSYNVHSEDSSNSNREHIETTLSDSEAIEDETANMEIIWSEKSFQNFTNGTEASNLVMGKHQLLNKMEMAEALNCTAGNQDRKKEDKDRKETKRRRHPWEEDNEEEFLEIESPNSTRKRRRHPWEEDNEEELLEIKSPNSTSGNRLKTLFICPHCECTKTTLCHLQVHIGNVHYKEKVRKWVNKDTLGCNLCQKTFKILSHLYSHLLNKHVHQVLPSKMLKKLDALYGTSKKRH